MAEKRRARAKVKVSKSDIVSRQEKLLRTLEQLLAIEGTNLKSALNTAGTLIAESMNADKVDVSLYDPSTETLVVLGTSNTPMSMKEIKIGMDRLPLANGGRIVEVYETGKSYCNGRADLDMEVLPGFREGLGICSMVGVPLEVAGERRGVLHVASAQKNLFAEDDVSFLEAAAKWVGALTHRGELIERLALEAEAAARQVVAEELITSLAHDLRNYITPIKGHIDLMRQRATREKRAADVRNADAALYGVKRLSALIEDLMDVARLEQGLFQIIRAPVNLVALIEETASVFQGGDIPVHLRVPEEMVIEADSGRIRQALGNLIANAVRYSPKGVPVTLELEAETREDGEWAVITVRDEGPGIDAKILPRLFTKFASGSGSRGLGLGLYLAHGIVEAHEGTLTVDTQAGLGASFKMSLPKGEAARGQTRRDPRSSAGKKSR